MFLKTLFVIYLKCVLYISLLIYLLHQGPAGAGNLSQCEHRVTSKGLGMGINSFITPWIPTAADHKVMYYLLLLKL